MRLCSFALRWSSRAGARNPQQVRENAKGSNLVLDPKVVDELTEATEQVKRAVGPNADLWQTESRLR